MSLFFSRSLTGTITFNRLAQSGAFAAKIFALSARGPLSGEDACTCFVHDHNVNGALEWEANRGRMRDASHWTRPDGMMQIGEWQYWRNV